jgi:hypothetical protein
MDAANSESHHQTLLHACIVAAACTTYFFDPVDVVWRFIRENPSRRALEHIVFAIATVLIAVGATMCTRAMAFPTSRGETTRPSRMQLAGEWFYAMGLASLLPMAGSMVLMAGETIRIVRLASRGIPSDEHATLGDSLRRNAAKWGVFITMTAFTITLVDRVGDYGILASVLLWVVLNLPFSGGRVRPPPIA